MNNADNEYARLVQLVLDKGRVKKNRTGIDTLGVFGAQARFDLSEGFPLLTTRKIFFRTVVHELLWFLSGSTNIKYLVDNDVHIWDDNCYDRLLKTAKIPEELCFLPRGFEAGQEKAAFIHQIKNDESFAAKWGELGEGTYGGMWRGFPTAVEFHSTHEKNKSDLSYSVQRIDQIQKVIDKLKTNPDDRRLIVSAWHPYWIEHCALPPCHALFQFHTEELTLDERIAEGVSPNWKRYAFGDYPTNYDSWKTESEMDKLGIPRRRLNCQLYQRSCDLFLGIPTNVASYALLTHMVAQVSNMAVGEFVHTYGDLHLYDNSIEAAKTQIARTSYPMPKLRLNPEVKNLFDFKFEDISVEGYESHPTIKVAMAV